MNFEVDMTKRFQRKKNMRCTSFMFYAFYIIMTVVKGMGLYEGMKLYDLGLAVAFFCLLLKLLSDRYSLRQLILSIATLALGILTWRISGKMGALFNLAVLAGMQGINVCRLFQVSAGLWSVLFSLQCFLTMSGIRSTQIFRIHRKLGTYLVRWSMGFTHPNVLHITYFVLLTFLFYSMRLKGRKLWNGTVLAMAGNILIFLYSVSYTGVVLVTLYLLLNLILQVHKEGGLWNEICNVLEMLVVPFCVLFSVLGPVLLNGRVFELANKLLSTRLELSRQYLLGQGIHLLGSANMEIIDATITVDCSYVYMLVHYGLVYFALFVVLLELAVRYYQKREDSEAVAILLACAVSGITEQYMANTSFKNVAVVLMAGMVYEKLSRKTDKIVLALPFSKKQICLLWFVPGRQAVSEMARRFCSRKRRIAAMAAVLIVLGTAGYCIFVPRPSALYASLWDCDHKEGAESEAYYYDVDLLSDLNFDGWILSDYDAQGRMYRFDGITADFEYARRAAGRGIALAILLLWVEGGTALVQIEKEE